MPNSCTLSANTAIKTMFRMVDEQTTSTKINCLSSNNYRLRECLVTQGKLPEVVLNFLIEMDRKLDAILGHLQKDSLGENFPYSGTISSLSTTCAVINCTQALAPNDQLELICIFQDFPLQAVSIVAEVKGLYQDGNDSNSSKYLINFIDLSEESTESIIQFLFQEERRRIRLQKNHRP